MAITDTLCECEFLKDLPRELISKLGDLGQARTYRAGQFLFAEGKTHPDFHLVVSGHVRLEMFVPKRGSIPILTAGPGEMLAWSALVGNAIMTSSGVALEQVTTIAFPGAELRALCETDHEIGYHMTLRLASALSRRLLATRLQLLDLFQEHIPIQTNPATNSDSVDSEC